MERCIRITAKVSRAEETIINTENDNAEDSAAPHCYAVVTMFGEYRRCRVEWHGYRLMRYAKEQTHWVERPEDEYGIASREGTFCVLRRRDWLNGDRLPICGRCGSDLEMSRTVDEDWNVEYYDCECLTA